MLRESLNPLHMTFNFSFLFRSTYKSCKIINRKKKFFLIINSGKRPKYSLDKKKWFLLM